MTREEKKHARACEVRLGKIFAAIRSAGGLASKAGCHGAQEQIMHAGASIAQAMQQLDHCMHLPDARSAEARTLPLFR